MCVWRADARKAAWKDTKVTNPQTGSKADKAPRCEWTAHALAALKRLIVEAIPEADIKSAVMARIEQSLDPTKALEGEDEMEKIWAAREGETPAPEAYNKSLAGQWRETGCAAEGAPYVVHALVARLSDPFFPPFRYQSGWAKQLAFDFLDDAHCLGAHGLSEADEAKLKKIRDAPAPQAPKP